MTKQPIYDHQPPYRQESTAKTGTVHLNDRSVTTVICTRDRPELLNRAIEGVVRQEHQHDVEIIVVFDQSEPDRTLEFDRDGKRLIVTTNARQPGLAGARNSGIDKASNAWVALCDDDDEWLPGKLAAQFEALEAIPLARAAATGIAIRYQGVDTIRIPEHEKLTFEGFIRDRMTEVHPSSWLVHHDTLVEQIGLVDEEIPGGYGEDYDFFLRSAKVAPIAVATDPLVRVWWHGSSFFFERWKMIDEALAYLVEKHPEFADDPIGLARVEGQRAVAQAAMGQRRRALGTAYRTARLNPKEKRVPVAAVVAAGVPASKLLAAAHRLGKGI